MRGNIFLSRIIKKNIIQILVSLMLRENWHRCHSLCKINRYDYEYIHLNETQFYSFATKYNARIKIPFIKELIYCDNIYQIYLWEYNFEHNKTMLQFFVRMVIFY